MTERQSKLSRNKRAIAMRAKRMSRARRGVCQIVDERGEHPVDDTRYVLCSKHREIARLTRSEQRKVT